MLALDERTFDQDVTKGWRPIADAGCDLPAADMIAIWRKAHRSRASILYWHEGQLRANAGQTRRAIALFERSRKTPAKDAGFGWNIYVDGSTAFLRGDRWALIDARERLARLPRPEGYSPVGPGGTPIAATWPLNLNVLDGFLRCWGQGYRKAYACAKPMFTYSRP